ncbi:MAG: DNA recombination protein RmuC [Alphaproteobacteria bacterium]|nr:DNA recombination protein RmuC [Alphaproteobacteria bacterium]
MPVMDTLLPILLGLVALVAVVAVALLGVRSTGRSAALTAEMIRLGEQLRAKESEAEARLKGLAEAQTAGQLALADRLMQQERVLARTLEERLTEVSKRVGDGLEKSTKETLETMAKLQERLATIDQAQINIVQLSSQMVSLQDILSNKQARGAFGEIQLENLVTQVLPPSAYRFQAQLSNGKRADCLLDLPLPPGPIVIDAKFPLEGYHAIRAATDDSSRQIAARAFRQSVLVHIKDIAGRYILPGETAESALMFLPSEAVYAELHAGFPDVLEESYRSRVFIVSPTTLWATLNTVRAILKDVRMREQTGLIQKEVRALLEDVGRLDGRAANLERHFDQAREDLRQLRVSTTKIASRGEKIEDVRLEDGAASTPLAPVAEAPLVKAAGAP